MNFHPFFAALLAFFLTFSAWTPVLPAAPQADDEPADEASDEPTPTYDEARAEAHAYAAQYKEFLSEARTEVTVVEESIRLAEQQGFRAFSEDSALTPGVKFYANNRDRALVLFVVGERPIREGLRIIAAHIDSPHLDLKPHPLQASGGFVKLQTLPNGYLKTYQWVNRPLALIGRVYKKDGQIVSINVGLRPSDPVFVIPDLAPHVDTSQRKRTARRVIGGEEMDPVAYSRVTKEQSKVMTNAKDHLKNVYGIEEEDFVSAELSFVPAQAPADVGFDGGLLGAYGQDDRSSAYAALRALLDLDGPRFTSVVFLADNEETGSNNNTGAKSSALNDLLAEMIFRQEGDGYRDILVRRALRDTLVVSADANPGVHPLWSSSLERANAPRLGKGVNIKLYGRGLSPNAEVTARLRKLFDDNDIPWQTMTYKVGAGGGGTLGPFLADDNMEVIDIGIPILSLHSPFEISSKSDLHALYRAMAVFFDKIDKETEP